MMLKSEKANFTFTGGMSSEKGAFVFSRSLNGVLFNAKRFSR